MAMASLSSNTLLSHKRLATDLHSIKAPTFFVDHLELHHSSFKFACFAVQLPEYQDLHCCPQGLHHCSPVLGFSEAFSFTTTRSSRKRNNYEAKCSRNYNDDASPSSSVSKQLVGHDEIRSYNKNSQEGWREEEEDGNSALSNGGLSFEDSTYSNDVDASISYFGRDQISTGNGFTSPPLSSTLYGDSIIPVKEPIYEVLEVSPAGRIVKRSVSRRQLLKSSGLRLRDVRSVDPSLWVTNSAPALLVRDQAILLNLGSLRAIGTPENVLIFDHKSIGAVLFLEVLLQRLNPESSPGVQTMPFELEVVEAALLSRTQRLERRLMEIEPRVLALLEVLPNRLTANVLEELRLSKQALVELGSKSGALRQMLLELLESPQEIRKITIMGRRCSLKKQDGSIECTAVTDKQLADDEEEEIEMLLENYLQRCESCHGQAERLLDSAREMEDSIAVNLSSRRLEVSRLELLLQVGTFCSALGALIAGIFGMNLRSYLEASVVAFWITTAGIILGGITLFFLMFNYLKQRKIL